MMAARPKTIKTLKREADDLKKQLEKLNNEIQAIQAKDLVKEGKIRITECTFSEWYKNDDYDRLWIYSNGSQTRTYMVEYLDDAIWCTGTVEEAHWRSCKIKYFGTSNGHLQYIEKDSIESDC